MISWDVKMSQYPGVGYYKIEKDDDEIYHCYFCLKHINTTRVESSFFSIDEATEYCKARLKEKFKNYIARGKHER